MPNPHRGEIEAVLDGTPFSLVLTLGALAELEHAFGDSDMLALAERFQSGRLAARDAVRIIGAGLRGAGHDIADDAVARMRAEGAAAGFVEIVARLLGATFGGAVSDPPGLTPLRDPTKGSQRPPMGTGATVSDPEGLTPTIPFPGTR